MLGRHLDRRQPPGGDQQRARPFPAAVLAVARGRQRVEQDVESEEQRQLPGRAGRSPSVGAEALGEREPADRAHGATSVSAALAAKAVINSRTAPRMSRIEPSAILPERRAEFHAVGAAQDVADGLDEACRGPQADDRAEPQQGAGAGGQHFAQGSRRVSATSGGSRREDVGDGQLRVLALPDQMRDRCGDDEEREQGKDRQIGKVAGVDEAVVINADGDALDHFPRRQPGLELLLDLGAEGRPHARQPLAPGFGRLG